MEDDARAVVSRYYAMVAADEDVQGVSRAELAESLFPGAKRRPYVSKWWKRCLAGEFEHLKAELTPRKQSGGDATTE